MCKRCRRKRLGCGLPQQVLTRAPSSQTITVFLGHENVWQIVHGGSWPCLLGEEMSLSGKPLQVKPGWGRKRGLEEQTRSCHPVVKTRFWGKLFPRLVQGADA